MKYHKYKRYFVMISYEPFWKILKAKGISQYTLTESYDISSSLLQRMRDRQSITLHSIQMLCNILDCDSTDIVLVTADEKVKPIDELG